MSGGGSLVGFYRRYQYPTTFPILPSDIPASIPLPTEEIPHEAVEVTQAPARIVSPVESDGGNAPFTVESTSAQTFSCPTAPPSENTAGCWMFPSGQNLVDRRQVNEERPPGVKYGEIFVTEAGAPGMGGYGKGMSPLHSPYTANLYSSPVLDSERRESTGILVNPYTGNMYETFMDDIPPPNTDKSIPRERFEMTNPKMIQMFGGLDPNRKLPSKKEICQDIPDASHGPNVWGDQLYADRRRAELQQRAMRDVWNHRDGDYSTTPVMDEVPVGYVGYVPAYRPIPYLPATNRNSTDNNEWTGIPEHPAGSAGYDQRDVIAPAIHIRKDEMLCTREPYGQPMSTDQGPWVTPIVSIPVTERETTSTMMVGGADVEGRINQPWVTGDVNENIYAPRVPEQTQYMGSGPERQGVGEIVISDKDPRPTLKTQMEGCFPVTAAASENTGDYVVLDTTPRSTLKTQMEGCFPITTAQSEHSGAYVVVDTDVKPTLKVAMEGCFPIMTASEESTGGYVVTDTSPRPTLKVAMEGCFPVMTASEESAGGYVVVDTDVRPTLKVAMEGCFPITSANDESAGDYVVIDRDVRSTQKALMQEEFDLANANAESTGEWIDFQGSVNPTRRQFYKTKNRAFSEGADFGQYKPAVDSDIIPQTRGVTKEQWMAASLVPEQVGGTSARVMGYADVETQREFRNRLPLSTSMTLNQAVVRPSYSYNCRQEESAENSPIRWLTPTFHGESQTGFIPVN